MVLGILKEPPTSPVLQSQSFRSTQSLSLTEQQKLVALGHVVLLLDHEQELFCRHKASVCTVPATHCSSSPLSSSSYLFLFHSGVLPEQAMFGLKLQRVESRHSAHSTSETRRTFQNGLLINVSMVLRLEDKIGFQAAGA